MSSPSGGIGTPRQKAGRATVTRSGPLASGGRLATQAPIESTIGTAPLLRIYSGTKPTDCGTALSGNTLQLDVYDQTNARLAVPCSITVTGVAA